MFQHTHLFLNHIAGDSGTSCLPGVPYRKLVPEENGFPGGILISGFKYFAFGDRGNLGLGKITGFLKFLILK